MSSLIELSEVNKTYHIGHNQIPALLDINFTLAAGEMLAIVGASGSGKSTLMNIMGLLDRCTSGAYYFAGTEVSSLPEQELAHIRNTKIGFVFQSFYLLPRMTALQNVMLPLFYRNMPRAKAKELALHTLEKVNIHHLAQHKPQQLSGGQQQRVAIARALVGEPQLILADEPTGALDSQTGHAVMDLLSDLNKNEHRTIVLITHDEAISQRCSRKLQIKDGRICS